MRLFAENLYPDHGQTLAVAAVLYKGRTGWQDVFVFEMGAGGLILRTFHASIRRHHTAAPFFCPATMCTKSVCPSRLKVPAWRAAPK